VDVMFLGRNRLIRCVKACNTESEGSSQHNHSAMANVDINGKSSIMNCSYQHHYNHLAAVELVLLALVKKSTITREKALMRRPQFYVAWGEK
jgi:hypothetical protein